MRRNSKRPETRANFLLPSEVKLSLLRGVSPFADAPQVIDVAALRQNAMLGSYRRAIG